MDWPANIPLPQTSLAGEQGSSVIRTQMETGRVRQRDRFGITLSIYNVEWLLLPEEYAAFKEFFATDLSNGLNWFNLPLPEDEELTPVSVRFIGGKFSKRYVPHAQWRITAQIETKVDQSIPDPELDIMPLLRQEVIEVTENLTLSMEHQNKLLVIMPAESETITITLPANAGFTQVFSCGFTKQGGGEVVFTGDLGVVVDSPEGALRIFRQNTPVTCTYRAANRFLLMGSLY